MQKQRNALPLELYLLVAPQFCIRVYSCYNNILSIKSDGSYSGVYLKFAVNNDSLGVTSATRIIVLPYKFSVFGDGCCKYDKDLYLSPCEFVG